MRDNTFSKKVFIKTVSDNLKNKYRKTIDDATQQELYQAVSEAVKDVIMDEWIATQRVMDKDDPKVVYYMSMEFLMGRALGNNLINLSAYKEVKEALNEIGVDINAIEDQEPDPALGNGGLGRLAACFMDSLAHLDILHTAVESDTDMVCSSSRFQTASRLRCLTTGSRTDIHSSFVVRSTAMRSSLEDMCRRAQMKTESFISSRRTISRCLQCLMICL